MDTFGIPLAFAIIASLTLWVVIGSKGWWWVKGLIVSITIFFSISLWHSLGGLEGWPTAQPMPKKFEVKWIVVEEPNSKTGNEGRVLVWSKDIKPKDIKAKPASSIPLLHNKGESNEPRLHKLPYSRELHEQAVKIKKKIASGGKFYGEMKKGKDGKDGIKGQSKGKGKGKGKGNGKGNGKGDGRGSLSNEQDPIFHELPPPHFPQKIGG